MTPVGVTCSSTPRTLVACHAASGGNSGVGEVAAPVLADDGSRLSTRAEVMLTNIARTSRKIAAQWSELADSLDAMRAA